MANFAVIETGGKQYRVAPGEKIQIEKLDVGTGEPVAFDKVLLRAEGDNVEIGTPHLSGAKVSAKVVRGGRGEKKIVFKYHSKTRYRKKKGHRQHFTEVEIVKV
ncbi:50S ribosomal protein L21 [Candidatus Parcubacteria bacterium]|nr:MAG: 50S ribosomal protein L21 [Candidatus Parcubacteria bacterium]